MVRFAAASDCASKPAIFAADIAIVCFFFGKCERTEASRALGLILFQTLDFFVFRALT